MSKNKQNYDKYVAKTQTSQNKQYEQEKQNDHVVEQELHLNHLMKMYHQQQNQCLITSKVDIISIKIENTYASQIVQIRRERERKVLEKHD